MNFKKLSNLELKQLNGGSNSWWENTRNTVWESVGNVAGRFVKTNGQKARIINKGYGLGSSPLK